MYDALHLKVSFYENNERISLSCISQEDKQLTYFCILSNCDFLALAIRKLRITFVNLKVPDSRGCVYWPYPGLLLFSSQDLAFTPVSSCIWFLSSSTVCILVPDPIYFRNIQVQKYV